MYKEGEWKWQGMFFSLCCGRFHRVEVHWFSPYFEMGPQLDGGVTDELERGSGRTPESFIDLFTSFWVCLEVFFLQDRLCNSIFGNFLELAQVPVAAFSA